MRIGRCVAIALMVGLLSWPMLPRQAEAVSGFDTAYGWLICQQRVVPNLNAFAELWFVEGSVIVHTMFLFCNNWGQEYEDKLLQAELTRATAVIEVQNGNGDFKECIKTTTSGYLNTSCDLGGSKGGARIIMGWHD